MTPKPDGYVTTTEMAKMTGMSDSTVSRWCKDGHIPAAIQWANHKGRDVWLVPMDVAKDPKWKKFKKGFHFGNGGRPVIERPDVVRLPGTGLTVILTLSIEDIEKCLDLLGLPRLPIAELDQFKIVIGK